MFDSKNFSSWILLTVTLLGLLVADFAAAQSTPPTMRTLEFDTSESAGVITIGPVLQSERPKDAAEPPTMPARGVVSIESSTQVGLTVSRNAELAFLDNLPPDSIQSIDLSQRQLGIREFSSLARFSNLQSLTLSDCQVSNEVWSQIAPFQSLRYLSIDYKDETIVANPDFANWARRCEQLQTLYCTPPLKAPAIKTLAQHPAIRSVQVSIEKDREAIVFQLLRQLPKLDRLVAMVDKDVSPRALDRIDALKGLSSITLSRATVDGSLLRQTAQIDSLRELRLIVATIGDDFLDGLSKNRSLESVLVHTMPMDDETAFRSELADTLLQMPNLKKLPKISNVDAPTLRKLFARKEIREVYIDGLARGTDRRLFLDGLAKLTQLRSLNISGVRITDDEMQSLRGLSELRSLSLVHTAVRGPGWKHLSNLPFLNDIQIMMEARQIEPELSALATLPHLRRLQILGLGFQPEHFHPVSNCKTLSNVALSEGSIDDSVAAKVAALPNLRRFNAWDSKLTARGVEAFLATNTLTSINVAGDIPAASIRRLATLPNLVSLSVSSKSLTQDEAKSLTEELTDVARVRVRSK